ncbi:sensor histidine kinase [uncultured Lacinutrix sp.]|uniref:sensor histidine kinase n=1 Tax=uncultured Lacinutrix sp. TaxID=574032 RepID=UPI002632AB21|nr:sensor histidine kinase [uncultured Lacinutrix sp.]
MNLYRLYIFFLLSATLAIGQNDEINESYEYYIDIADKLNRNYQFSESIEAIEKAILISKKENNLYKRLSSEISLAELMRRTKNYKKGLEILYTQKDIKQFPLLQVRRLDRMSALYSEGSYYKETFSNNVNVTDSVQAFLEKAISISIKNKFENHEASLRNQMGLFLMRKEKRLQSRPHLLRSAELFKKIGDTANYLRPMMHIMENNIMFNNMQSFDSIGKHLLTLTKGKKWYSVEAELFKKIGAGYLHRGDSITYYKWLDRAGNNYIEYYKRINSEQMAAFKVRFETDKFKREALESNLISSQKSKKLDQEKKEKKNIIYFSGILLLILFSAGVFIIRERKLKQKVHRINTDLEFANEKYELLMIESNHRIKNNLQMIISLLDYSNNDFINNGPKALKRVSSKVETIASLHKHLNENVHFEKVRIDLFFEEVIALYKNITTYQLVIKRDILPLEIKNERIVYFGLILNELLSNTIEHNISDIKNVNVEISIEGDSCVFVYCDFSQLVETESIGMGITLIKKLIRRVGGNNLCVDKLTGSYKFKFNV